MVIQDATCGECQDKHTYERDALKVDLLVPRVLLQLHGRKRTDKKPLALPPVAIGDRTVADGDFNVHLDVREYPPVLEMLGFRPAGLLAGEQPGLLQARDRSGSLARPVQPELMPNLAHFALERQHSRLFEYFFHAAALSIIEAVRVAQPG
jgi:hypothetical protein